MATRKILLTIDDLDGTQPAKTFTFGYQGRNYEIDLNDAHAAQLHDALAQFIAAARAIDRRRKAGTQRATA
ncbi:Lsr2 dimerization domain-containing protein [Catellatospora paridis]|uniref:Lsr2 dimerization domain-containing protein n=1 Tax=Catellatospora paridis TaxID=1617086 RepID=UPI0012D3B449|nr:histone-like nucleoid-structuring protein Lsr2 [Catellatospora paridis]